MSEYPIATPPPVPEPAEAKQKSYTGLIIALIGSGLVFAVASIAVVVFLVLPLILPSAITAPGTSLVRDIPSAPKAAWALKLAGKGSAEFLNSKPGSVELGDGAALLWADFDYDLFEQTKYDSLWWYEGVEDDYAVGLAAGEAYLAAKALANKGEGAQPVEGDFMPQEWWDLDKPRGSAWGWTDATFEYPFGTSLPPSPPGNPDYTPVASLVNLDNGEVRWSIDLVAETKATYQSRITAAAPADGSGQVIIAVRNEEKGASSYILALDRNSGEIVSKLVVDGTAAVVGAGDAVIALLTDDDVVVRKPGKDKEWEAATQALAESLPGTVMRIDPQHLDGEPTWQKDLVGVQSMGELNGYLAFSGGGEYAPVLVADDGSAAAWGADFRDENIYYYFSGDHLIREEQFMPTIDPETGMPDGVRTSTLMGYDALDGTPAWKEPVVSSTVMQDPAGNLFVADADVDGLGFFAGFFALRPLDPATGTSLWAERYEGGVYGGGGSNNEFSAFTTMEEQLVVLSLTTGLAVEVAEVNEVDTFARGAENFYVQTADELIAVTPGTTKKLWTLPLDDGVGIVRIGGRLLLFDPAKAEITGLS